MSEIERNDPCPCGSGKKYKKCCLDVRFRHWRNNAVKILEHPDSSDKILTVFFGLLAYIEDNQWMGACHASSSVLYVILRETNLPANIYIGQVKYDDEEKYFDHSWVEIDDEIYDAAVLLSLQGNMTYPPVIRGFDVETLEKNKAVYGCISLCDFDPASKQILQISITEYMNHFPGLANGLWDLVLRLGQATGLLLEIPVLQKKYSDVMWQLKHVV